ncbi:hypothetical protein HC931_18755 [Candidatus Gracilibacteria bacterium]|nr:hypothetical protein [Candidatus Gracilibacteria bacterium]NJM88795.1 hypothetical protein [Hydrococcus sp. RU_2_2]NJP21834.1 hypothetical protein [Hydrococcus sp. CRU_1_1]
MKACWISLVVELGTPRYIAIAISVGRMSVNDFEKKGIINRPSRQAIIVRSRNLYVS